MIAAVGYVLLGAVVVVVLVVAGAVRVSSRGSRAEEQREREGGWRP